ncbi:MAG: PQQ-binding-like beta-propeller repeat protein [Planctomycetota bacterium]
MRFGKPGGPEFHVALVWLAACLGARGPTGLAGANPDPKAAAEARRILAASGVTGGLIVHVGCGDGRLTAALGTSERCLVHGLDRDRAAVARARDVIRSLGLYGRTSAEIWERDGLPYADNLVNLLIVSAGQRVPEAEIRRVLAPRGVALISKGKDDWRKLVKPWPPDIDEWTHWLHGPDGNAVADDNAVGPPGRLQWMARPLWLKHHNATIGWCTMVSAQGRLFYILDESPPGLFGLPRQWALIARDAFNGTPLWKRKMESWGWRAWVDAKQRSRSRFDQPTDLQRRLVAVGDCVYVPLGDQQPLSQLDAETGDVVRTYPGTERVSEVLHHDGTLIVSVHRPAEGAKAPLLTKTLLVFDADSGSLLWKQEKLRGVAGKTNALRQYTCLYLTASADRLFYVDADSIVAVSVGTGEELWRVPRPPRGKTRSRYASLYVPDLCTLVACGDVLLFGQSAAYNRIPWNKPLRTELRALSAKTGETVWRAECGNWGYGSPPDVFVTGDQVWVHDFGNYSLVGLALATGDQQKAFPTSEAMDGPHHHRCYRNKATARYVLASRRGVEFLDIRAGRNLLHHWVRGACRYGVLPCNGLLYVPPDPCMCYATAKVNGLLALTAGRQGRPKAALAERLERGPAFGKIEAEETVAAWPTYRHDPGRSGATSVSVPSEVGTIWRTGIGGRPSSVTVAGGKVFVASVDGHTVHAVDEKTGAGLWQYTAGGPVDSPPTWHKGMVLFGSADGWVYCLRASDGALAWRFRAAPAEVRTVAFERLASPWPVHGSVLVRGDVAYVAAGRSSFLDGGIRIYSLDPASGTVLQQRVVYTPDPATGQGDYNASLRYDMPPDSAGALSDILVSHGDYIYMRQTKIDPENLPRDFEQEMTEQEKKAFYREKQTGKVLDFGPQVVSTAGLLDGSWFNQTFWSFARRSHCRLLVHDARSTYGVRAYEGRASRHARRKFVQGAGKYTLFADDWRSGKRRWSTAIPVRVRAMVATGDKVFVAGTPDRAPSDDPWAAYEGRAGGMLWVVSKKDGKKLAERTLECPPVWDGMAAAGGRLYFSGADGTVACLGEKDSAR